ncbi:MAG: hypothetical protein AUH42_02460 [Gemmatimonadetes bacterium 13_1_40CM_70_11]|nr:MAG: hypothetical protein AUH42_02460 [Gemmatimonadetes bacterium 13_1_40CM_70_11]
MRGLLLLLMLTAACGGRTRSGNPGPVAGGDVILSDELRQVQTSDLWTALHHLRPNWFRRSPSLVRGQGDLLVVVDRVPQRGNSTLRQIPVAAVLVARYFSPTEATALYGQSALYGAIVVSTAPR